MGQSEGCGLLGDGRRGSHYGEQYGSASGKYEERDLRPSNSSSAYITTSSESRYSKGYSHVRVPRRLFTIVTRWRQPKCAHRFMDKEKVTCNGMFRSLTQEGNPDTGHSTDDLEDIMLRETGQPHKAKLCAAAQTKYLKESESQEQNAEWGRRPGCVAPRDAGDADRPRVFHWREAQCWLLPAQDKHSSFSGSCLWMLPPH